MFAARLREYKVLFRRKVVRGSDANSKVQCRKESALPFPTHEVWPESLAKQMKRRTCQGFGQVHSCVDCWIRDAVDAVAPESWPGRGRSSAQEAREFPVAILAGVAAGIQPPRWLEQRWNLIRVKNSVAHFLVLCLQKSISWTCTLGNLCHM